MLIISYVKYKGTDYKPISLLKCVCQIDKDAKNIMATDDSDEYDERHHTDGDHKSLWLNELINDLLMSCQFE